GELVGGRRPIGVAKLMDAHRRRADERGDVGRDASAHQAVQVLAEGGPVDVVLGVDWTTLGEYLDSLVRRGISPNVASFVGATTVRIHELGYADRPPTPDELT